MKKSSLYYKKATLILYPLHVQLGRAYSLCADSQREGGYSKDAIDNLLKAYSIDNNISHLMTIANIYDEKLSDRKNAIIYYKSFLDKLPESKFPFHSDYIENIRKRLDYLEKEAAKRI
jgi:tetratricopeptide (TPR) repeat protein